MLNIVYVLSIQRNYTAFWAIIGVCALYAFIVLPKLKTRAGYSEKEREKFV